MNAEMQSRDSLVSLFVDEFRELPPVFLITSQAESDIAGQFRDRPHITKIQLEYRDRSHEA
jgi:hypothetical protein